MSESKSGFFRGRVGRRLAELGQTDGQTSWQNGAEPQQNEFFLKKYTQKVAERAFMEERMFETRAYMAKTCVIAAGYHKKNRRIAPP